MHQVLLDGCSGVRGTREVMGVVVAGWFFGRRGAASSAATMRATEDPTSSCSQTRITCQPGAAGFLSVSRSRSTFVASFSGHYSRFLFGVVPWCGHECQKHPSTKTATLAGPKTMSARRRIPFCEARPLGIGDRAATAHDEVRFPGPCHGAIGAAFGAERASG